MANKKINQLVLKTTIQSTDLFPLGDATTGQLYKKTIAELQAAIGGAVISVNGLVGTVVLDTDDIQELASPTNKYFTDARARAAISLTTTGNSGASTYSSSTGVLNVPTYTLAGLGGITASFLSGGTGITYNSSTGVISYSGTVFTDASIRALVSAGTGLSYNSSTGVFSYSGTVYTDSSIRALISLTTNGSSGSSTYNNTTGVLNIPTYTLAGLGGISLTSLSGSAPITYNSSTGAIGITQASGSANGFLSSTDWTTFNSKQSALTLGNVTESVSNVLMFPDGGTNKTIGNLSIQVVQAGSTTNGYLSTTDWNTFNNKQNAITLTTTGTSGAATFSGGTLNIPQYQGVLTNPVTGTGTSGYHAKWTSSSAIGNGLIYDTGSAIGIGTTTPSARLEVQQSTDNYGYGYSLKNIAGNNWQWVNGGDNNLYIGYNTTTKFFIGNNGNVGIGTVSPGYLLTLGVSTGNAVASTTALAITTNGEYGLSSAKKLLNLNFVGNAGEIKAQVQSWDESGDTGNGTLVFNTRVGGSVTEKMRITSAGNVGIGTASPNISGQDGAKKVLTVSGGGGQWGGLEVAADTQSGGALIGFYGFASPQISGGLVSYIGSWLENSGSGAGSTMRFFTRQSGVGLNEIFRLTGSRNMLIGTDADNGERLYVSGSIRATGSITANSDARLKKNIERIENALEKVGQISGYTYNTIYDEDRHAGVIAQEVDKVLPEIVNKGNDGLMGVEYGNISALLIEAIKDLKKDNESLRAIVEGLSK